LNDYLHKQNLSNNLSDNLKGRQQKERPQSLNIAQEASHQMKCESSPTSPKKQNSGVANRNKSLNDELLMQLIQDINKSPKGKNMKASISPKHTLNQIKEEQDKKRATSPLPAMASPAIASPAMVSPATLRRSTSYTTVNNALPQQFRCPNNSPSPTPLSPDNVFNFNKVGTLAHSLSTPSNQSMQQQLSTTVNSCYQYVSGPCYTSKLSNTSNSKTQSTNK